MILRGSLVIDWEEFAPTWSGVGWSLEDGDNASRVTLGSWNPGVVNARWAGTPFEASFSPSWTFFVAHRWDRWSAGGASLSVDGSLWSLEPAELGPFDGDGWHAWIGFDDWLAFYGEAHAEARASRNVLVWLFEGEGRAEARWGGVATRGAASFWSVEWNWDAAAGYAGAQLDARLGRDIAGQGKWRTLELSRAQWLMTWIDQNWGVAGWSLGLGTGMGLFWIENPIWTQFHTWSETTIILWPPQVVTVNKTTQTDYILEASPGWVLVLHPRFTWEALPTLTVSASRWIPLTGGVRLAVDEHLAMASPPAPSSSEGTNLNPWDLWLAGTQFEIKLSW